MSIEIIKESNREEEKPIAVVINSPDGDALLLLHGDRNKHYGCYLNGSALYVGEGSLEDAAKRSGGKRIYSGGEIKLNFFAFHRN